MAEDPLLALADDLYALPPGEFTAARDARAQEYRTGQSSDKELAARVKALRKPSMAAWVVNLLVRREADQVVHLLEVGEALRRAQEGLDATQLRELTRQRRKVTSAVAGRARALAAEEGHRLTSPVLQQVEDTLTAAMVDEGAAAAVRSGLLVATLRATGVDAVDVAPALAFPESLGFSASKREAEPARKADLHVVPDLDAEEKAREAADLALAAAEEEVRRCAQIAEENRTAVGQVQARELQANAEIDELRRRLADAEERLDEVEEELAELEELGAEADEVLTEATQARDAAAKRRELLT